MKGYIEICPKTVLDRVTYADLIELSMLDFDIIFGMDWLHRFYDTIGFPHMVVSFQFPNKLELEWKGVVQI